MITKTRLFHRDEASKYLEEEWGIRRTPKTLAKLAVVGGGPKFRKDGRFPLYADENLDEWARAQLSPLVSSTSEFVAMGASDASAT